MKANRLLVAAAAALALTACGNVNEQKCLVLYYSQNGTTEAVANEIAGQLGVEAVAFDVENPYTGTFEETIERCIAERQDTVSNTLAALAVDPADYDVIFLGYPIWFGTYAPPVQALLDSCDFAGKTVVPFCTFGSGGLESSVADLREACPEANVTDGYGVRAARIDKAGDEVKAWLTSCGYLEGEVEDLPDYGDTEECTEGYVTVFNDACGDYPMPIGTPVSVRCRKTSAGIDYIFDVTTSGPDGSEGAAQVYVTWPSDGVPEFTKVVR